MDNLSLVVFISPFVSFKSEFLIEVNCVCILFVYIRLIGS